MKIIQICAAYKPAFVYGGPTMSVAKLSEELTKAGQDVTVFTTTANGQSELDVPIGKETLVAGVKVLYFKRLTKDHTHFSPSLLNFLHQTIKNTKRQTPSLQIIIHIHAWWNLVSILSCLVAKWHGVKVILSPRGMLTSYSLTNRNSKFKNAIHTLIGKHLLKYCHIHATSNKEQKDILQTCEVNGITIIPNFVEFPVQFSPSKQRQANTENNTYRLIFLSRVEEKKGLALLFEALAEVSIPWTLSIAGSGDIAYEQSLRKLAAKLSIDNHISWLGHVSNDLKFDLLAQYDLLVLPSFNENFANVVIESLAMGTPVLISEEVGLADYVLKNDLGWVSPLIKEKLSQTIQLSYEKKEQREAISANAPEIIRATFAENDLIANYREMYQNLMANVGI